MLNGDDLLAWGTARLGVKLSALVASCTLWAHPRVFQERRKLDLNGAWFPNTRRARKDEERGNVVNGIILDDNSKANAAIKKAVFGSGVIPERYSACHIWPKSCYDPRYHTCIANLVLLPAALASLTDHDPEVIACLKYRSFELYGWHPAEMPPPERPAGYPDGWLDPSFVSSKMCKEVPGPQKPAAKMSYEHGKQNIDDNFIVNALRSIIENFDDHYEKVSRRKFREINGDHRIVALGSSENGTGFYVFDVYDDQINFCKYAPSVLMLFFYKSKYLYFMRNPFDCMPLKNLRSNENPKNGKIYRRLMFGETPSGSLSTGDASLDAMFCRGTKGTPYSFGV
ncbi:hypothetical protein PJ900_20430 [Tistrella mobilis]|uniref:hypothetical protein n=2 Tax=Tistrella mobilis TaxID=171437 RepID=UPI00355835F2